MLNAAIIGLGWWGRNIVESVQGKSAKIRFVHGVSKELDAALPFAEAKGFTLSDSLETALADPRVEAVVLATPHSMHADQIVRVAAAGKPVFSEKPLTLRRADAERAVNECRAANVILGVGQNKRFWPSMQELRRVAASGMLGSVMHIEGHYSNENSSQFFAQWRDLASETPGAGMTGTGIHLLDAFVSLGGAVSEVDAQLLPHRGGHDPRDTISVLLRFVGNVSGYFGAVRPSPVYWRVHVFGDEASVEALGESRVVVRSSGGKVEVRDFARVDSLLAEFDAFTDAIEGRAPYPITPAEMVDTIAAFEAIIRSIDTGSRVALN